jgi:hypothetical protein
VVAAQVDAEALRTMLIARRSLTQFLRILIAMLLRARMAAKETGDCRLVDLTLGDTEHQLLKILFLGVQFNIVQTQEDECGHSAGALVAINKRMIPHDVEQIGCGHFEQIRVQVLSGKS